MRKTALIPASVTRGEPQQRCLARDVFDRIGDKWSVEVIYNLTEGTRRFTELRREIDGISQRMLTVTLRALERDGIVRRTVFPVVPPRVEYELTPLGETLRSLIGALVDWSTEHTADVDAARLDYDRRVPETL
ncbi:helix-turn-helix transcriptional regulator [Solihabitans fulvus]|uniref:Helix-turn-helix transcriptional regulator n=1 Tax=Solihabitans fulvus TaxID=1892852 RepID=A0A5B2WQC5_9PSEU|nr:helix-turn-helix transcriptional regulator [Solihabitans fulvus]